jgi:hypothetical protein
VNAEKLMPPFFSFIGCSMSMLERNADPIDTSRPAVAAPQRSL